MTTHFIRERDYLGLGFRWENRAAGRHGGLELKSQNLGLTPQTANRKQTVHTENSAWHLTSEPTPWHTSSSTVIPLNLIPQYYQLGTNYTDVREHQGCLVYSNLHNMSMRWVSNVKTIPSVTLYFSCMAHCSVHMERRVGETRSSVWPGVKPQLII